MRGDIKTVKAEFINNKPLPLKADDLDKSKLGFISFGSLCGIGIGLLLSFIFTTPMVKLIIAVILLFFGFSSIMKALPMLRK